MKKKIKKLSNDDEIIKEFLGKEENFEIESDKNDFFEIKTKKKEEPQNFESLLETFGTNIKKDEKENKKLNLFEKIKDYPPVQKTKDLHGTTSLDVEKNIRNFISESKLHGIKTVKIITGKGIHSKTAPIIPEFSWDILVKLKRENKITYMKWDKKNNPLSGSIIVFI